MRKHDRMQRKYFIRQLRRHLLLITLPILLFGLTATLISRNQLEKELSVYAERAKNDLFNNVMEELNCFSAETALFSNHPSMDLPLYKLMNEQTMDYKDNVLKTVAATILGTATTMSNSVSSICLYYDNPYGNYLNSINGYTSLTSPSNADSGWFEVYRAMDPGIKKAVSVRYGKNYSFESVKRILTVCRRLEHPSGVMVLNLTCSALGQKLKANQIYLDTHTLVSDANGQILFGDTGWESFIFPSENALQNDPGRAIELPSGLVRHADNNGKSYITVSYRGKRYILFSTGIPEYNLLMTTLISEREVFATVQTMSWCFTIIIILSILLSISLSLAGTFNNFRQLQMLLDLFSHAEQGKELPVLPRNHAQNEYDQIFNNIIQTFITNNTLQFNLANAKIQQKDAQIAALQLQINPHFIFNTLQTVDMEIRKSGLPEENAASKLIYQLSDILKYSLENTFRKVTLRQEIEVCKTYASIQKFRYSNPFILYWDYSDALLPLQMNHLILQPLLENSLHHGIKELPRKGLIKVKILERKNRVHFYVIDNGIGISQEHLTEIRSRLKSTDFNQAIHIGLYNTNLRLILTYGPGASIDILSKNGMGTVVHFSIPKQPDDPAESGRWSAASPSCLPQRFEVG